jgi:glycosyltransferase involved in cell wall biosynthesis
VRRLAEWHDLWVLTEATQYQTEVEKELAGNPTLADRLHFSFIPREAPSRPNRTRPVLPVQSVLAYRNWHQRAFQIATRLHEQVKFDVIHHLRGNSFREPGYCWKLPVPFVWGPTGGSIGVPWRMFPVMGIWSGILHGLRNAVTVAQFYSLPRVRAAARKASCVLAQTTLDQIRFRRACGVNAVIAYEQAGDPSIARVRAYDSQRPLRIAWAARFIPLKGLPILLHALSNPKLRSRVVLDIAGDGPCRDTWVNLAKRLEVDAQCAWHGWMPPGDTVKMMDSCDVFACTNLLAAESTIVMQAMSLGLPVICLRHGWPSDLVDGTCGVPVRVDGFRRAAKGFSDGLVWLIENPSEVRKLSQGACEKARAHSWDRLATLIREAYENAAMTNNPVSSRTTARCLGETRI